LPKRRAPTLKRLQILAGLGISAGALYLALRDVHWREVGTALQEANYWLVAGALALLPVSLALRAARWRALFHPIRGLSLLNLFGCLNVGYLINNILPFQVGDLGRAYLLSELEGISTTRSVSTVVVERILDIITLLLLLLVLIPFVDLPSWARAPMLVVGGIVAAVLAAIVFASLRREFVMRVIDRVIERAPAGSRPKLSEMAHEGLDGLAVLSRPLVAAELLIWSLVNWLSVGCIVFAGMKAFDLDVGFDTALFVLIATSFGFLVPSSPGSFGVYHAIVVSTLTGVFDIGKNAAVSYALVIHLVFYLPPMLIAIWFLWAHRGLWSLATLTAKVRALQGERPGNLVTPASD
jgi:uncharacterized protein (TIRG00374 family)